LSRKMFGSSGVIKITAKTMNQCQSFISHSSKLFIAQPGWGA
jgi:hypothetical protein